MARRAAHARYSAVDFRGSPGLLPRRSVGVSPMPTIAVFARMLINYASIRLVFNSHSAAQLRCQGKVNMEARSRLTGISNCGICELTNRHISGTLPANYVAAAAIFDSKA